VELWQGGSKSTTDWNIDSDTRFRAKWEGEIFEQWGKVMKLRPYAFIKYSLFAPRPGLADKPENDFIMSCKSMEENGRTKPEILQEDKRPDAVQGEPQGEPPLLKALKEVVKSR
jgi:hypothetical protein